MILSFWVWAFYSGAKLFDLVLGRVPRWFVRSEVKAILCFHPFLRFMRWKSCLGGMILSKKVFFCTSVGLILEIVSFFGPPIRSKWQDVVHLSTGSRRNLRLISQLTLKCQQLWDQQVHVSFLKTPIFCASSTCFGYVYTMVLYFMATGNVSPKSFGVHAY